MEQGEEKEPINRNTRFVVTREVFDHLYAMLRHEDEKANRILGAMAFIALAGSALAIPFFEATIGTQLKVFGISLGLLLFFAFFVLLTVGTLFILAALGPVVHIKATWVEPEEKKKKRWLPSILYFKDISNVSMEEWTGYFKETDEADLVEKLCRDHVAQSYALANRAKYKAKCIKTSKIFFRFSLIFLLIFIMSGFCLDFQRFHFWSCIIFSVGFFEWSIEYLIMPMRSAKPRIILFIVLGVALFAASLLFL
jgi:hypothetical protein